MDILFATTELAPYVKVGGLADVSAALPKTLRMLGHSATIVVPRFPGFEEGGLLVARRLTPLRIPVGDTVVDVTIYDGRLPSQVELILVDAPNLVRDGVYGESGEDYVDNASRFSLFSRAVAEIARLRAVAGKPVDIVHCNDWPTALVPAYLAMLTQETPALAATKSVLTIHNVAHQGVFPAEVFATLGLPPSLFAIDGIEFYGGVNLLKQGIVSADAVVTVSETYAREIQTPELGCRLDGVLSSRARSVIGITNGVDASVWNPATDPTLVARYDAEDLSSKARCRGALQKELGLAFDSNVPLVASVGRIVVQKGSDLVAAALPRLLRSSDAQFIVAGDGDPTLVKKVEHAAARSHGRAVFVQAATEPLVHRIFSASDIVLVPSRFEPCGLVQLYAQRYGALPVARATGGLVDTIVDCDAKLETGTGFLFDDVDVDALVGATERAISGKTHERWPALVRRVMRLDRSWDRPARRYEQVYRSLFKQA